MAGFLDRTDAGLLAFATPFSTKISAGPTAFGLTAGNATALAAAVADYSSKLAAAQDPATRGEQTIFLKDLSKDGLITLIRQFARQIQGTMTVTDAQRQDLGLPIRDTTPSPAEPITVAPALTIQEVFGHNVRVRVRDASGTRRGRPAEARGCILYSFVGATPPAGAEGWISEGPIARDSQVVAFNAELAPGTKVWFTAQWFNAAGTGPGCSPVPTQIGVEGALAPESA